MVKLWRSPPGSVLYMTMEFQIKFKFVGKWSMSWKDLRVIILPFYSNCSAVHCIKHKYVPRCKFNIFGMMPNLTCLLWGIQNHPVIAYIKKSIAWTFRTANQLFWKYFLQPYFTSIYEDFTPSPPPLPHIK